MLQRNSWGQAKVRPVERALEWEVGEDPALCPQL
jgi:hypothetical protein